MNASSIGLVLGHLQKVTAGVRRGAQIDFSVLCKLIKGESMRSVTCWVDKQARMSMLDTNCWQREQEKRRLSGLTLPVN